MAIEDLPAICMCWLFERKQHIIYYFSENLRGGRNRRDRKEGTEGEWRGGGI